MKEPTKRAGRPLNLTKRVIPMLREVTEDAASNLARQARLGDPASCEAVLSIVMQAEKEARADEN